jgi:hypothetical protein
MLQRLLASTLLVAVMTLFMLPTSVSSAPGGPPGYTLNGCLWKGIAYLHNALRYESVYFNRTLIHYDIYRCVNGAWIYVGSSDDQNP